MTDVSAAGPLRASFPEGPPDRAGQVRIESRDLALLCARACQEKKGEEIRVLDVSRALAILDYFVIVTGKNRRHVRALADDVRKLARERGARPRSEEGGDGAGRWLLLDLGDVIVHFFDPDTRRFYDIEALWADAPRVDWEACG
ncbi:MAG: ribosome silencing factor [Planctomycetes bacterium]|nr:ribosome silencing factor [Planctomycetota bacterium]